jgi:hypothetical protein
VFPPLSAKKFPNIRTVSEKNPDINQFCVPKKSFKNSVMTLEKIPPPPHHHLRLMRGKVGFVFPKFLQIPPQFPSVSKDLPTFRTSSSISYVGIVFSSSVFRLLLL